MPPVVYTSDEVLALEIERIFRKEWICVGHISEVKDPGNYITFDLVGHPILLVRDDADVLHAYSNVCQHRSARLLNGSGNIKQITCPYHAWTYELGGKLQGAPLMDKEQINDVCLNELRLEIWQGLAFVNLDQQADSLAPRLDPLLPHIEGYNFADKHTTFVIDDEFDCNWKVLVENFCESYHVFKVHRTTLEPNTPTSTTRVLSGGPGFNHHTMTDVVMTEDEPSQTQPDEDITHHLNCIYPCMTLSIGTSSTLWLSILPLSRNRLKYRAWIARDDNNTTEAVIQQEIDHMMAFMQEDKIIITGVQQGLESGAGNRGPLNYLEKTNWEFGHYYANKLLA